MSQELKAQAEQRGEAVRPTFNQWWLSLPEGRRNVLIDDKWALASAAYDAAPPAPAEQRGDVLGWLYRGGGPHPVDDRDEWKYWHGSERPVLSWDHQEIKPVYTATPAPVAPDDVVKDAARYRWLRDQDYDDGCVIAMKEKHIPRFVNYSQAIDDYIDAAMLSAAPEVKP